MKDTGPFEGIINEQVIRRLSIPRWNPAPGKQQRYKSRGDVLSRACRGQRHDVQQADVENVKRTGRWVENYLLWFTLCGVRDGLVLSDCDRFFFSSAVWSRCDERVDCRSECLSIGCDML